MRNTELFLHNKFNEIKQNHVIAKTKKSDRNIHSLMLLSNPFVSSQIKSKYSSLISNAVSSFLDHNPKERDISNNLYFFQMGLSTNRKLMNTKQAITNFLNSSTKEKKGLSYISKYNNYIHGPNPFDSLTTKSVKSNYLKKTRRSGSSDDSVNIIKKIKDFTSTINRPTSNMTSTNKITLKKDGTDLMKALLLGSSSLRELNQRVKSQLNINYKDKANNHMTNVNNKDKDKKISTKIQKEDEEENNKEQCNTLSIINDLPLTDRQKENQTNTIFHLSPIINENSINESDTFLSFKSYILLNTPN